MPLPMPEEEENLRCPHGECFHLILLRGPPFSVSVEHTGVLSELAPECGNHVHMVGVDTFRVFWGGDFLYGVTKIGRHALEGFPDD